MDVNWVFQVIDFKDFKTCRNLFQLNHAHQGFPNLLSKVCLSRMASGVEHDIRMSVYSALLFIISIQLLSSFLFRGLQLNIRTS